MFLLTDPKYFSSPSSLAHLSKLSHSACLYSNRFIHLFSCYLLLSDYMTIGFKPLKTIILILLRETTVIGCTIISIVLYFLAPKLVRVVVDIFRRNIISFTILTDIHCWSSILLFFGVQSFGNCNILHSLILTS